MTKMRLLKRFFPYDRKRYVQGDVFDVRDQDVKILSLSGIAERVVEASGDKQPPKRKPGRPAGTVQKAGEKKKITGPKRSTGTRRYRRRDMQAEK